MKFQKKKKETQFSVSVSIPLYTKNRQFCFKVDLFETKLACNVI